MSTEETIVVTNQSGEVENVENKETEKSTSKDEKSVSAKEAEETKEESETSEKREEENPESDHDDEEEGEEDDDGERKDAQKKPRKNGLQKRFNRFRRDINARDEEIARLKAELESKGGQKKPAESQETTTDDPEPNPDDFEKVSDYTKALTKWEIRQLKSKQDAELEKSREDLKRKEAQGEIQRSYNERLNEFKKTTRDFDEAVSEFMDEHGDFQASPAILEAIQSSEYGPGIFYEVIKTPGEYERLSNLSEAAIIRELGRIEARLEARKSTSQVPKVSKAPAPAKPLGGAGGVGKKSIYDKNLSQEEYERLRDEMEKNRK